MTTEETAANVDTVAQATPPPVAAPSREAEGALPVAPPGKPWVAHYDAGVPTEIEVPPLTVDAMLRESARRDPDHVALVFFGKTMTYGELDQAVDRFAHALRAMGVETGDRVSLHLPTSPAFVIAFEGTLRAGAIAVPMNPLYVERELEILFRETQPTVSVTLDLLVPRMRNLEGGHGGAGRPGRLIVTGIQDSLPVPIKWLYPLKARREGRWNPQPHSADTPNLFRLLAGAESAPFESAATPDDPAALQPTGGTTGIPKTAILTHRNLVANAVQCVAWFSPVGIERPTILCPLPLFHIYGLTTDLNYAMRLGGTLILLPRFDPEQVLKAAAKYKPQSFPGAPVMYETLAHHPEIRKYDLSSIRACISGAAPLPPTVQHDFEEITGGHVCEGYGLTEASPVTHCNPLLGENRLGTIGLPFPSTGARVVDPATGAEMPPGEVGELEVSGPQVMTGYWGHQEETEAVLHDGWLRTGDMAECSEAGYFRIVDRSKDLIIVGGINVYPREVEEVLLSHPAVADAAVIGMPHEHYGEVPCAFVVLKEGETATAEMLIAYCRDQLARFKVPVAIRFRPKLPKTMIGKVLRKDLRVELGEEAEQPAR